MKKTQYIVFISCSIVLLVHIFCTVFFNFYAGTENTLVVRAVRRYMLPIFSQNNKVFAPDPPLHNQQLVVRYFNPHRGWTGWIDPGKTLLDVTYSNRFSVAAVEHAVHEYVLVQVWDAHVVAESKSAIDSLQSDILLHDARCVMAQHYFSDMMMKETSRSLFKKIQYKIIFTYPEKFTGKSVSEIKSSTSELLFPEMNFIPRNVQGYK